MSELSQEPREELTRWAESRTFPVGDPFRARLILALADGKSWNEIDVELHTSGPTIARWKRGFERQGMAGIRHRLSARWIARRARPARGIRVSRSVAECEIKIGYHVLGEGMRELAVEHSGNQRWNSEREECRAPIGKWAGVPQLSATWTRPAASGILSS